MSLVIKQRNFPPLIRFLFLSLFPFCILFVFFAVKLHFIFVIRIIMLSLMFHIVKLHQGNVSLLFPFHFRFYCFFKSCFDSIY